MNKESEEKIKELLQKKEVVCPEDYDDFIQEVLEQLVKKDAAKGDD